MKYGIIITQNQELNRALESKKVKIATLKGQISDTPSSIMTATTAMTPESDILDSRAQDRPIAPKNESFLMMLRQFGLKIFSFYPHFKNEAALRL